MRALSKDEKRWVRNHLVAVSQGVSTLRVVGKRQGYITTQIKINPAELTYETSLLLIHEGLKVLDEQAAQLQDQAFRAKAIAATRSMAGPVALFVALAGLIALNYFTWKWTAEKACSTGDAAAMPTPTSIPRNATHDRVDGCDAAYFGDTIFSVIILCGIMGAFIFCVKSITRVRSGVELFSSGASPDTLNKIIKHLNKLIVKQESKIALVGNASLANLSSTLAQVREQINEIQSVVELRIGALVIADDERPSAVEQGLIQYYDAEQVTASALTSPVQWQTLAADFVGLEKAASPDAAAYTIPGV